MHPHRTSSTGGWQGPPPRAHLPGEPFSLQTTGRCVEYVYCIVPTTMVATFKPHYGCRRASKVIRKRQEETSFTVAPFTATFQTYHRVKLRDVWHHRLNCRRRSFSLATMPCLFFPAHCMMWATLLRLGPLPCKISLERCKRLPRRIRFVDSCESFAFVHMRRGLMTACMS